MDLATKTTREDIVGLENFLRNRGGWGPEDYEHTLEYALEETIWTTYHPTKETDLAIIEDQVIAKSFDELDALTMDDGTLKIESTL